MPHPLTLGNDPVKLDGITAEFKQQGIDGIEAFYKPYSRETTRMLTDLAEKNDFLICSGSDFHGDEHRKSFNPGIEVPCHHWEKFKRALGLPLSDINPDFPDKCVYSRLFLVVCTS